MPKSRLVALVCLGALAGPLVAGCTSASQSTAEFTSPGPVATSSTPSASGSASVSSSQLLLGTQKAATGASSVQLSGTRTDTKGRTVSFDETGTMDGSNMHASSRYDEVVYEVLIVNGTGFVKGNKAYWTQEGQLSDDQAEAIGDKWVQVDSSLRDQIQQMSPQKAIENIFSTLSAADFGPTVTASDASGVPAYKLTDGEKKTVVAATGTLLPIHLSTEGSSVSFDKWNAAAVQTAPPADQVIDASSSSPSPTASSPAASAPSASAAVSSAR